MLFGGALIALQFVIYDYCRVMMASPAPHLPCPAPQSIPVPHADPPIPDQVQFHVSPDDLKQFFDVMADVSSSVEAA
jgi:hypothetical protein